MYAQFQQTFPDVACSSMQFHLYTAMVMDGQHGGVPVAWYITSRSCTTSVESFLEAILHAARKIQSDFEFGSVGCDDANEEINAIRWHLSLLLQLKQCLGKWRLLLENPLLYLLMAATDYGLVFCRRTMPGVPIFLCAWHVKQAWLKNLKQKVQDNKDREAIRDALDKLMRLNVDVPRDYFDEQLNDLAQEHLQAFYRRFAGQAAFIEYFRKEWAPKIGKRLSALP